MRRASPLVLLAIVGISWYLYATYQQRSAQLRESAPPRPAELPARVKATASEWTWEKSSENGGPDVFVKAKEFKQIEEPSRFELQGVEMKICRQAKATCDVITSERAEFDMADAQLYSEGDAFITMGAETSKEGEAVPSNRVVHIQSSGIRFDSRTGKAETDRDVTFQLERGQGRAVGATYDPATRDLILRSQAQLIWNDNGPHPRPMKVESQEVVYKENESKVFLSPWSKFTRGSLTLEGQAATVTLDQGGIRLVQTTGAKGSDRQPGRTVEYSAGELTMSFSSGSEVEKILGNGNARLVAQTAQGTTTTQCNQVEMEFEAGKDGSILRRVLSSGSTVIESKPLVRVGRVTPETRVVRSDVIDMRMRPGGEEIDTVDTLSPASIDFLPNHATQKKRRVEGDRFHFSYAAGNHLDSFRATKVTTRTENPPKQGKPQPPSITTSAELSAQFAPRSGELARLEQWGSFRYEEGDRRAKAERAVLQNASNQITLVQDSRVWDTQGATAAGQIVLDQASGDFQAEGNVESSRIPDRKGSGSTMLAKDEATQAKARRMWTRDGQSVVHYEGNAVLWQGSSRLEADRIEIDRKQSLLIAQGHVFSQLLDQRRETPNAKGKTRPETPVFTLIRAPALVYRDRERIAHYTGGASLKRLGLDVTAREIKAFLKEQGKEKDGESSLDRAAADGAVLIVQNAPDRVRKGASEHADYFVDDERVVLEGGDPKLEDSKTGLTRGNQLIYFANDDRLLVNGTLQKPAVSRVRRK